MRLAGSSSVSLANMITKRAATPGRLRRRMRPIRWIIWRRVRLALMTMPRFASGTSMPSSSTRARRRRRACGRAGRRGSRAVARRAVEPVMRSIDTSGSSRLMAWFAARTVSVNTSAPSASLIAGARLPSSSYLPLSCGHDLAPLGERVEILARGAAVGTGVALGEVRDRGEEVAERLERHVRAPSRRCWRAFTSCCSVAVYSARSSTEQLDADERDPRRRAHAVGDGLLEAVAVADAAEVRQQQLGHRVVAAFERRGEAEPFVVLRQHRAAQRPAAEAVALVGDEQPAGRRRAAPACTRRPSGGSRRARRTTPERRGRCRPAGRSERRAAPR